MLTFTPLNRDYRRVYEDLYHQCDEKTADTSATSAENSFPENTEAAAEKEKTVIVDLNKSPEDMTVDELQQAILAKMAGNGLVTDQMKKTVYDNIWHDSLVNWLKSFH